MALGPQFLQQADSAPKQRNVLLESALAYAERGWCVLPTHSTRTNGICSCGGVPGCKPGKHPLIRDWATLASNDITLIREWWQTWPWANVAILTGQRSGVVVADIDCHGDSDGLARLEEWEEEHGPLPETMSVRSGGGGRHVYFLAPDCPCPKGKLPNGMGDFQADNAYVLAPPSIHPSGVQYVIEGHGYRLAPLPHALRPAGGPPKGHARSLSSLSVRGVAERQEVIHEGRRNDVLFRLGCRLREGGFSEDAILAALLVTNRERCRPPLDASEVEAVAASASRYEANGARLLNGGTFWPRKVEDQLLQHPDHHRLFHFLVNRACWENERWGVDRARVGEVVQSFKKIARACSWVRNNEKREWSTSRLTKLLNDLETWGFLKRVERRPRTRIRIVNYNSYQGFPSFPGIGLEQLGTGQSKGTGNGTRVMMPPVLRGHQQTIGTNSEHLHLNSSEQKPRLGGVRREK